MLFPLITIQQTTLAYLPKMKSSSYLLYIFLLLGIAGALVSLPFIHTDISVKATGIIISEHGVNLSGGQRQRIAIARALYRNPEILILDEATSSLDPVSEQKVHEALDWFKEQGKTVIIIAHRLATIKNCDQIIVLKDGKLLEQGKHDSLILNSSGYYFSMWQSMTNFSMA